MFRGPRIRFGFGLFVSKGNHGIHPGGSTRRKASGQKGNDGEQYGSSAGLLVTQSDHRIHTHGSPRRNVASKKHYSEKQGDHGSKGHRVGGTHAEKKTGQEPRQCESRHQPESHSK